MAKIELSQWPGAEGLALCRQKCKVAEPALAREQKERNMDRFLKMRFNREINQLFNTFCRSWKSGAKASLNLSTENRVVSK